MQLAGNGFLLHLISLFSAEEILTAEGFSLKGKSKSKWLAFYMGIRSAVFDDWTRQQIEEHPNAVVIHLGWGMDSRCLRVGTGNHKWYDVDFPDVIEERKRYYAESDHCRMIPGDVREQGWLDPVPETKNAITPQSYIDQLMGLEKRIFSKLYAENFAKKPYRMFEYCKA